MLRVARFFHLPLRQFSGLYINIWMFEYFCLMFSLKSSGTLELTHFIISSRWSWTQSHPFSDMKTGKIKIKNIYIYSAKKIVQNTKISAIKKIYSSSFWNLAHEIDRILIFNNSKWPRWISNLAVKKMVQNSQLSNKGIIPRSQKKGSKFAFKNLNPMTAAVKLAVKKNLGQFYHRHSGTWNRWPSQSFGVWCPNWLN